MNSTTIATRAQASEQPMTRDEAIAWIVTEQRNRINRADAQFYHYRAEQIAPGRVKMWGPRQPYNLNYAEKSCTCPDAKWCKLVNTWAQASGLTERLYCKHWRMARRLAALAKAASEQTRPEELRPGLEQRMAFGARLVGAVVSAESDESPAQKLARMRAEDDARYDAWGNRTTSDHERFTVSQVRELADDYRATSYNPTLGDCDGQRYLTQLREQMGGQGLFFFVDRRGPVLEVICQRANGQRQVRRFAFEETQGAV